MKEKFYNAWYIPGSEWSIHGLRGNDYTRATEDSRNPKNLSFEDATTLCRILNDRFRYGIDVGYEVKQVVVNKVIPGIPLDPTLPVLMAGYIQDRARKRYRHAS